MDIQESYSSKKLDLISVVVPVHNEEWSVVPLYGKMKKLADAESGWSYEFIFVNDGSTDETERRLDAIATDDERVKSIHLNRNFGVGYALMAGIDHASGDYIVTMDGNLQNDPMDIPMLIGKLREGYDVCSGWRRDSGEGTLERTKPRRIFNWLVSRITGLHLHDYECTLNAYRRDIAKTLEVYGESYRFFPVFTFWRGARIAEVPVTQYPRAHGYDKREGYLKRSVKIILDLILLKYFSRYRERPLYVFGTAGIVCVVIALLAFTVMIYYKASGLATFIETPLPLIVVFATLAGIILILMGILAEMIVRVHYKVQNEPVYVVKDTKNI